MMKFPKEQPTSMDLKLWRETIQLLTSPKLCLSPPLGKYLRSLYTKTYWLTDDTRTYLLKISHASTPQIYGPCDVAYRIRGRQTYQLTEALLPLPEGKHSAMVKELSCSQVTVQSQAHLLGNKRTSPVTLKELLAALGTPSL